VAIRKKRLLSGTMFLEGSKGCKRWSEASDNYVDHVVSVHHHLGGSCQVGKVGSAQSH
jgi:hypothetical protein